MLNERLSRYLNALEGLALQPANRWDGFVTNVSEGGNFALHLQLALPCYALAALHMHPEAEAEEQARAHKAMVALVERALQRRVWAERASEIEQRSVLPDVIAEGHIHYSAHLAMMIGALEMATGDRRYDEPFTLFWHSDARFSYTHTSLASAIARQMRATEHGGVESSPGRVVPFTMHHAIWALALHDASHNDSLADAGKRWQQHLANHMVLAGPTLPGRGAFRASYNPRMRSGSLWSNPLCDAWSLATLAALAPELTQQQARRFWPRLRRNGAESHAPMAARLVAQQQGDSALATAWSYLLAVELDDASQCSALLAYAEARLANAGAALPFGGAVPPCTTALFALGEAGGLRRLRRPATPQAEAIALELPEKQAAELATTAD
ncbi:MAG: hypothetical protein MUD01_12970 [Chloroflexaceae bacterium]|jgi:hypothetical protein|nr:hypothetical protein [Chloroflexaceae bacterium]